MDFKKKTNKKRCRACPASGFCSDVCYNRDIPDVTCAHAVKYDKLNKRIAALEGQVEAVKFMSLKQRDVELENLQKEIRLRRGAARFSHRTQAWFSSPPENKVLWENTSNLKCPITGTIPAVLFCSLTETLRPSMSCGKR